MYVDDGTWASRLALKDKSQATVQDLTGLIKSYVYVVLSLTARLTISTYFHSMQAASADAELPESLTETARQFSTLDVTMKNTRQNMVRLSQVLLQVQDANFRLLDNLRATNETSDSLRIQPPVIKAP
ncbi:hypothetical protein BGZ83_011140 [Gryganskiella cystojenkinii]|nr:hypothetical protein BGZ83_011140 [Gryganskiella cystojenkinii]